MAKVRAAVLAAGRGVRIGADRPKTLVPVDGRRPLLHYILTTLEQAGIQDLLVVTGYEPQAVQEFVSERWHGEATFVFNARFASWGNFHTVRLALDQSPGLDVLVVNSDIVVPPGVLQRTVAATGDLVLAVQRRLRLDAEDMKVELIGERVRAIGKELRVARSNGEYAGVSLIRPDGARAYLAVATDHEWVARTSVYYEDIYAGILGQITACAVTVEPDEYAEVDVPADFTTAAAVIDGHFGPAPVGSLKGPA